MIFAYTSRLDNTGRFVRRVADKAKPRPLLLEMPWNITDPLPKNLETAIDLAYNDDRPMLLFVPSYRRVNSGPSKLGLQYTPLSIERILLCNDRAFGTKISGVVGTGNRGFGPEFCLAAREVSDLLGVPLVAEVELSGTDADDDAILRFHNEHRLTAE